MELNLIRTKEILDFQNEIGDELVVYTKLLGC